MTTTDSASNAIGVFLGCSYTNPSTKQPLYYQCYDGPVTASDIMAFVQDDPDQLYKVAVVSATTTIGGVTRAAVGQNAALVQNTGSTTTGDSGEGVTAPTAGAGNAVTLPVKVISVVPETAVNATNYSEVVVILTNPQITRTTGNDFA